MTQLHNTKRHQNSQSGRVGLAGATIGARIQIQIYNCKRRKRWSFAAVVKKVRPQSAHPLPIYRIRHAYRRRLLICVFVFLSLSSICLLFSSGTSLRMQWISLSFWQSSTNYIISIREMVVTASTCRTETVFDYSWKHVVCAYWNRYPNPSRWVAASWLSD